MLYCGAVSSSDILNETLETDFAPAEQWVKEEDVSENDTEGKKQQTGNQEGWEALSLTGNS